MIGHRMVDLAWQAYHSDYSNILTLCDAMEIKTEFQGNVLKLNGIIPTAIYNGLDPMTIFVCLGFAFFGYYWCDVCGENMKDLNKMWKEEIKSKKRSVH